MHRFRTSKTQHYHGPKKQKRRLHRGCGARPARTLTKMTTFEERLYKWEEKVAKTLNVVAVLRVTLTLPTIMSDIADPHLLDSSTRPTATSLRC